MDRVADLVRRELAYQVEELAELNLLPGVDASTLLKNWKRDYPRSLLRTQFARHLPAKLGQELQNLFWPEEGEKPLSDWPDRRLEQVGRQLQAWVLKPAATEGYRTAEVTLGGVDTRGLSSKTMESGTPGLFFIGEVVDVTGHLGGFNFQWAWSSGFAAGNEV